MLGICKIAPIPTEKYYIQIEGLISAGFKSYCKLISKLVTGSKPELTIMIGSMF